MGEKEYLPSGPGPFLLLFLMYSLHSMPLLKLSCFFHASPSTLTPSLQGASTLEKYL